MGAKIFFVIIIAIFIFFMIIGCIDGNRYRVVEESIVLDKIKKDFKFVLISDLHNKVYGKGNEKVIEDIRKAQPDFIIVAGDLVTSHVKETTEPAVKLLEALSKEYKIYYAMGNHETKIRTDQERFENRFQEYMDEIRSENVIVLRNEKRYLENFDINVYGLELERDYFPHFKKKHLDMMTLEKKIGVCQKEKTNILIAHHPDYFEAYANWGADLVLSGHVHGGIMRLPLLGGVIAPSYEIFPKYDGGIFKTGHSIMLLGRGMGAHTIPFRFFNPAELYVVNCLHK